MNENTINILLVEDEASHADLISRSFESATVPVTLTLTRNLNEARVSIAESVPDLIIADNILPDGKGTDLLPFNKEEHPYPVVIMTSHGDEKVAVEAIKAGAFDYIVKSVATLDDMPSICEKILLEWNHTIRHKRVEQELKESEAKFQSILSSLYESAVIIYDRDGIITALWGTPEMDKRYGLRAVDAIGRLVMELVPPEQAEQRLSEIRRVFDDGEKMLVEYMVVLPNGNFWHETSLSPMRDANGNIAAVVGFIRDVTERNKAREQLRKLAHAVEQSSSVVIITDTKGNIEYANPKFTQLTDYALDEAIGNNPRILKSGKTPPEIYKELWDTIKSGNEWRGEFSNRKKNGELYWEYASISPVKNDKGVITNFIAIKDDITERKEIEESLRRNQNQFLAFTNVSPSIIFHTNNRGKVMYASKRWSQFSGLPDGEWKDDGWASAIHPDDRDDTFQYWQEAVAKKEVFRKEFRFLHIAGTTTWLLAIAEPCFNNEGDFEGYVGIATDVTERKKMEETLLQSEKLTSLGEITAGVAHEFNNILAVVMGSAEVLEGGFKDDQELKRGLKAIIEAGEDGAGIVKRMLTFATAELSESDYIFIDIQYLIKQAIEFTMPRWKNMAQAEGIKYHINTVGIIETPEVFCNPTEMREVFVNLINNAMDAMSGGGTITVATRCVRQPAELEGSKKENASEFKGDFVEITFEDTGKGMPEDVKKKIFDPFFTTRRPHGIGLGMSVAYGIIKKHGGEIEVESEVGKGTIFKLSIPIRREVVQRVAPSEPIREITTKKHRILVIDDEKEICAILNEFLTREGHIVKAVNNGTEGIELSRREEFDLVLCDLAMPDVTGHDVIKVLNELDKRPKIGLMTGWCEDIKHIDTVALKVDFIARKPFNLSELASRISDLGA
ncbi:MAG: PAS domain S-box protein [Candidatus Brocadiales bacterium]|nr:PAS domain S-box protein [Candidatus Brocadiales bacterium]